MRGYYLMAWGFDNQMMSGVKNKIEDQLRCLRSHFDIDLVVAVDRERPLRKKIIERLPFQGLDPRYLFDQLADADFLYVRRWQFSRNALRFFRMMKKRNPNLKIIVEIPTYPYDGEMFKSPFTFNFDLQDRVWRNRLAPYVDHYVIYGKEANVFGVDTIRTQNGIDLGRIPLRKPKEYDPNRVELIAVANPQVHHGYDRVIQGLGEYFADSPNCDIHFTLVGDGPLVEEYRSLAEQLGIGKKIIFAGALYGEDLAKAFDQADIALGSFGFYRIGLDVSSALKTREYLARGLPLVNGSAMDILDPVADSAFYFQVPNDSSAVRIEELVDFYREAMKGRSIDEKAHEIRRIAEERVSMEATMEPIIDYLSS